MKKIITLVIILIGIVCYITNEKVKALEAKKIQLSIDDLNRRATKVETAIAIAYLRVETFVIEQKMQRSAEELRLYGANSGVNMAILEERSRRNEDPGITLEQAKNALLQTFVFEVVTHNVSDADEAVALMASLDIETRQMAVKIAQAMLDEKLGKKQS